MRSNKLCELTKYLKCWKCGNNAFSITKTRKDGSRYVACKCCGQKYVADKEPLGYYLYLVREANNKNGRKLDLSKCSGIIELNPNNVETNFKILELQMQSIISGKPLEDLYHQELSKPDLNKMWNNILQED